MNRMTKDLIRGWLERNWRQWEEGQRKEKEYQRPFEKKRKSKKAKDQSVGKSS